VRTSSERPRSADRGSSDSSDVCTSTPVPATLALAPALLRAGAPGLHLYTYNKARPSLGLLARIGLFDPAA